MTIEIKTYLDKAYKVEDRTWFDIDTDDQVVHILSTMVHRDQRIRFWYGYTSSQQRDEMMRKYPSDRAVPHVGWSWNDEYDVSGTIGRSTGPVAIPLLIHSRMSIGGGAILADSIIKIITRGSDRQIHTLYQHPRFKQTEFIPGGAFDKTDNNYYFYAYPVGSKEYHARFNTMRAAERWCDFMAGKRMVP